ncbi:MAG: hypothetical protein BGO12_09670 [Verrucomicrobia bacterium 61-8]|nr:MAG: hypothetical protein BGO12_09670 [Verrucomicrobia bacterium 61-8]
MAAKDNPAMIVEPEHIVAVMQSPCETGGAGMLEVASVSVSEITRLLPGAPFIAAVTAYRVPVYGAINDEERTIAQLDERLFLCDRTASRRSPQTNFPIWQSLPSGFCGIIQQKQVVRANESTFGLRKPSGPEPTHLVQSQIN